MATDTNNRQQIVLQPGRCLRYLVHELPPDLRQQAAVSRAICWWQLKGYTPRLGCTQQQCRPALIRALAGFYQQAPVPAFLNRDPAQGERTIGAPDPCTSTGK